MGNITLCVIGACKRLRAHAVDDVLQDEPEDYVIATGTQYSVRQFIIWSANVLGIDIEFRGSGLHEIGVVVAVTGDLAPKVNIGQEIICIDPAYFRPAIETLLGDPSKAKRKLGWEQNYCSRNV